LIAICFSVDTVSVSEKGWRLPGVLGWGNLASSPL